jgi:hypothetical protein
MRKVNLQEEVPLLMISLILLPVRIGSMGKLMGGRLLSWGIRLGFGVSGRIMDPRIIV